MASSSEKVSQATLEDTPRRAVEFIRGVGASNEIMRSLAAAGYSASSHEEGIRLVNNVLRFVVRSQANVLTTGTPAKPAFGETAKQIKQWVKTDYRRVKAALSRFFPEQGEYLCQGLELNGAMDAVAFVELFLQRFAGLNNDPARKAQRKQDHAALALLESRGITRASINHLITLVAETHMIPSIETSASSPAADDARLQALVELRAWYADWAETARVVITRRDHLIRIGLAVRKSRSSKSLMPLAPEPLRALPAGARAA